MSYENGPNHEDTLLLHFLCDLHAHLPEAERPMGWSDFSETQRARAEAAFARLRIRLAAPSRDRTDPLLQSPEATARRDDSARCIQARNKLNAALHGEGAVIDDLELAVDTACYLLRKARAVKTQGHPEPVAWRYRYHPKGEWHLANAPCQGPFPWPDYPQFEQEPLYASPVPGDDVLGEG